MIQRYSVIGLGKLGASMVAAIASRGIEVIGVDVAQANVQLMNTGRAPVQETNLDETVSANRVRIRATTSYSDAIHNSDLTFVVVPTPSDGRGAFSLRYAAAAFREIGRALRGKGSYHTVVLTSTVLPGSVRHGLLPLLEDESGKRCGKDFGLCYGPEFIALGSVIHDFLHPDFTLIGEYDKHSGDHLEAAYLAIMLNRAPCRRMTLENAELAKIALNAYVTTKITFANLLCALCERIPDGDIDVVTGALGLDSRIGRKYLTGGMGYGGPCFPRDNVALAFFARSLGVQPLLAEATDHMNRSLPNTIVDSMRPFLTPSQTVAVLGLAYKPLSDVIEESQSIQMIRLLAQMGLRVRAYDPLAGARARDELQDACTVSNSLDECLANADIVIITTPDPVFKALPSAHFEKGREKTTVFDAWRILKDKLASNPRIHYMGGGIGLNALDSGALLRQLWKADAIFPASHEHADSASTGFRQGCDLERNSYTAHRAADVILR